MTDNPSKPDPEPLSDQDLDEMSKVPGIAGMMAKAVLNTRRRNKEISKWYALGAEIGKESLREHEAGRLKIDGPAGFSPEEIECTLDLLVSEGSLSPERVITILDEVDRQECSDDEPPHGHDPEVVEAARVIRKDIHDRMASNGDRETETQSDVQ